MGRFIFKSSLVLLLLLCSCTGANKKVSGKNIFEMGDRWFVKDFSIEQYPTIVPFEKNALVDCLDQELFEWQITSKDTLLLKNGDKQVLFRYTVNHDTISLLDKKNNSFELVAKKISNNYMNIKLIGLWHANLNLQKR